MSRLPVAAWLVAVVLVLVGIVTSAGREELSDVVLFAVFPLNCATVGALVVSRAGGNRVGWVFLALGIYIAAGEAVEGYGLLAADTRLTDTQVGLWVGTWAWLGQVAALAIITALFPDGRTAGRAWSWVPWAAGTGAVVAIPGMAFGTWADWVFASGSNPFLVDSGLVQVAYPAGMTVLAVSMLGAAGSLIQRLRRARGVPRQQLKWFALAACLMAALTPVVVSLWATVPAVAVVVAFATNLLPLAAGIAILRHGLYDIDVVIKRTLVYTALTVAMVTTYVALVLLLQVVLRPVAGRSDLAVAASTLTVAALFRPLRAGIQRQVDRRFYRSRYDAALTMSDFTDRLRHEVDLDSLGSDLRAVVHDTMQPAHVSLWLRSGP